MVLTEVGVDEDLAAAERIVLDVSLAKDGGLPRRAIIFQWHY